MVELAAQGVSVSPVTANRVAAVRRKTRLADLALLLLIVLLTGVAVVSVVRLYSTAEDHYAKEAFPIDSSVRDSLAQMLNQETGVRGYLITARPASLQPYVLGRRGVAADFAMLRRLSARRPEIVANLVASERLVQQLEAFYAKEIALVRQGRRGQAEAQRNVLAGKALFDRFRVASDRLAAQAATIVRQARTTDRRTFWATLAFDLTAGAIAAAIAVWLLLTVPRRIWSLYEVERGLRLAAERGERASRSLAHVGDAVVLLDPDGTIRHWNPAATEYLQVAEAEALDRPVEQAIPEIAAIEQALAEGSGIAVVMLTRDGEGWYAVRESRFSEGRVLVLRNVTAERRLETARSEFLATASHELRTPLGAVYGAVRTLRRPDRIVDPAMDARLLEMIEQESERLSEVVDQILVSTRLDRGELRIDHQRCELRELCASVIASAQLRASPKHVFSLDAPEPVAIECDPARLQTGARELARQRAEVHAERRPHRHSAPLLRSDRNDRGHRSRDRHRTAGPDARLRQVLPRRPGHDRGHRRQRPRSVHQPRTRRTDGGQHQRSLQARKRLHLHRRTAGTRRPLSWSEPANEVIVCRRRWESAWTC